MQSSVQDNQKNYAHFQLKNLTTALSKLQDNQQRNVHLFKYVCACGWSIKAGFFNPDELAGHFIQACYENNLISDKKLSATCSTIERAIRKSQNNQPPEEASTFKSKQHNIRFELKKLTLNKKILLQKEEKKVFKDEMLITDGYQRAAIYDFHNDDGELCYQKIRYEKIGAEKTFLVRHQDNGKWFFGKGEYPELPYNNIELCLNENVAKTIVILEGEKDAETAIENGLLATSIQSVEATELSFIDRNVIIVFDNDKGGRERGERTAKVLTNVARSVKLIELSYSKEGEDYTDWVAYNSNSEFGSIVNKTPYFENNYKEKEAAIEGEYILEYSKPDKTLDVIDKVLSSSNIIYHRAGRVVQLVTELRNGSYPTIIIRKVAAGRVVQMVHRLTDISERKKDDIVPSRIKVADAKMFLELGEWGEINPLYSIINSPLLLPNGEIWAKRGYHEKTGFYLDIEEGGWVNDEDPYEVIMKPFREFPFREDMDRAMYLAALVTAIVRHDIPYSPAFIINATEQGSGKTLLARCIGMLLMGRDPDLSTYSEDKAELNKCIDGYLLEGTRLVVFDNITRPFGSEKICSILTSENSSVRELGGSEQYSLKNTFMLVGTGNGMSYTDDMGRRVCQVNLDAQMERPQAREFDFNPLDEIRKNRKKIVTAIYQAVRAARLTGVKAKHLGSYEEWGIVADTVLHLTGKDITDRLRNPEVESLSSLKIREIMQFWYDKQLGELKAADISKNMKNRFGSGNKEIAELGDKINCSDNSLRIGAYLAKHNRQRRNGLELVQKTDKKKGHTYNVVSNN